MTEALKGQPVVDFPPRAGSATTRSTRRRPPTSSSTSTTHHQPTTTTTTTTTTTHADDHLDDRSRPLRRPRPRPTPSRSRRPARRSPCRQPPADDAPTDRRVRDAAGGPAAEWLAGGCRWAARPPRLGPGRSWPRRCCRCSSHGGDDGAVGDRACPLHPEGLGRVGPVLARLLLRPAGSSTRAATSTGSRHTSGDGPAPTNRSSPGGHGRGSAAWSGRRRSSTRPAGTSPCGRSSATVLRRRDGLAHCGAARAARPLAAQSPWPGRSLLAAMVCRPDLFGVALVSAGIWAWSRRRPVARRGAARAGRDGAHLPAARPAGAGAARPACRTAGRRGPHCSAAAGAVGVVLRPSSSVTGRSCRCIHVWWDSAVGLRVAVDASRSCSAHPPADRRPTTPGSPLVGLVLAWPPVWSSPWARARRPTLAEVPSSSWRWPCSPARRSRSRPRCGCVPLVALCGRALARPPHLGGRRGAALRRRLALRRRAVHARPWPAGRLVCRVPRHPRRRRRLARLAGVAHRRRPPTADRRRARPRSLDDPGHAQDLEDRGEEVDEVADDPRTGGATSRG